MTAEVMQGEQKSWAETPPMNPPLRYAIAKVVESQSWLDKLAAPFQGWLLKLFGQPGQPNRKIKDMLNGTWLGHPVRSEEHTSELQSHSDLVCRLLLEKK